MLGKKWWPIGCDPYKITTEDFKQELLGLDLNHPMRLILNRPAILRSFKRMATNEHNYKYLQSNS